MPHPAALRAPVLSVVLRPPSASRSASLVRRPAPPSGTGKVGTRVKLPEAECEQQARRARGEVPGAVGVVTGLVSYVFKAVTCPASGRPCDNRSLRDAPAATALPIPWVRHDISASSGNLCMAGVRGSTRRPRRRTRSGRRHSLSFCLRKSSTSDPPPRHQKGDGLLPSTFRMS